MRNAAPKMTAFICGEAFFGNSTPKLSESVKTSFTKPPNFFLINPTSKEKIKFKKKIF